MQVFFSLFFVFFKISFFRPRSTPFPPLLPEPTAFPSVFPWQKT